MEIEKQERGKIKPSSVRLLGEMEKVVYDKDFARKFPEIKLYYVYRGVDRKDDLRYDLTVIPPRMLGIEFVRTKGNRNSGNYFELYTVLEGEAIFLLQKAKGAVVEDIIAVRAKKGGWVNISSDYAVVLINPLKETLKTGNWVSEKNQNIYKELEEMGGMSYFYTQEGWLKNKNYSEIPDIRFERPLNKMPADLNYLRKG